MKMVLRRLAALVLLPAFFYSAAARAKHTDGLLQTQVIQAAHGGLLGVSLGFSTREAGTGIVGFGALVAAGIIVPRNLARTNGLTQAQANSINFLSLTGLTLGITAAASGGRFSERQVGTGIFLGGVTGSVLGYSYAYKSNPPTIDQSALIISGVYWGTLAAAFAPGSIFSGGSRFEKSLPFFFWGQIAGTAAGFVMAENLNWSRQKTVWVDMAALGGAAFGWGLSYIFDAGENTSGWLALVSMAAAMAWTIVVVPDRYGKQSSGSASSSVSMSVASERRFILPTYQSSF